MVVPGGLTARQGLGTKFRFATSEGSSRANCCRTCELGTKGSCGNCSFESRNKDHKGYERFNICNIKERREVLAACAMAGFVWAVFKTTNLWSGSVTQYLPPFGRGKKDIMPDLASLQTRLCKCLLAGDW